MINLMECSGRKLREYGFEVEEKHEYEICRFSTKVMKLCPKKCQPLSQYLLNNARFKNLSAMINAGTQITASFRAFHNQGDSYQDVKLPIQTLSNCSTAFFSNSLLLIKISASKFGYFRLLCRF